MIEGNESSEVLWMKLIAQSDGVTEYKPDDLAEISPIEIDLVDAEGI